MFKIEPQRQDRSALRVDQETIKITVHFPRGDRRSRVTTNLVSLDTLKIDLADPDLESQTRWRTRYAPMRISFDDQVYTINELRPNSTEKACVVVSPTTYTMTPAVDIQHAALTSRVRADAISRLEALAMLLEESTARETTDGAGASWLTLDTILASFHRYIYTKSLKPAPPELPRRSRADDPFSSPRKYDQAHESCTHG